MPRVTKGADRRTVPRSNLPWALEDVLLIVCLGILALRVTYTEAPVAHTLTLPGSITDTVYSLTLSGLLIFAFVFWLLWRPLRGRVAYRVTGMEIGAAVFGLAALLSTLGAANLRTAVTQTTVVLGPILAALLLAQILDSPARIQLVLIVIVALGIVSAYQGAEQFFVSNSVLIDQYEKTPHLLLEPLGIEPGTFSHFLFEHRLYGRGIRGFFTTGNSAAAFATCAAFAAIALLAGKWKTLRRYQVRSVLVRAYKIASDDATTNVLDAATPVVNKSALAPDCREEARSGIYTVLALVLVVSGLLLNQSKGGTLAFLAGLGVFGVLMAIARRPATDRRRMLRILVVSALLLLVVIVVVTALYGIRHGGLPDGNSMLVRWQYWTSTARMYADHPRTGVGPGNFSDHYPHYKPAPALESVADPHNWPLSLIAQYGPLGLAGFLMMVFLALWRSCPQARPGNGGAAGRSSQRKLARSVLLLVSLGLLLIRPLLVPTSGIDDPHVRLYEIVTLHLAPVAAFLIGFLLVATPLGQDQTRPSEPVYFAQFAALLGAVLAVLLHNLVDFALFEPGVWMTFWLLLACLAAMGRQHPPAPYVAPAWLAKLRLPAVGLAIVLVGIFLHWIWIPVYRTTSGIQKAQRALSAGRFDLAQGHLDAARRADRLSPVAAAMSGRLYLQRSENTRAGLSVLLEEAARCFQEAIARNPADYKNYEKLALTYRQLGQLQKAYDGYLQAAGLYPGCERLWLELAQIAEGLGRPAAALGHYARAVAIEDSYRQQFRRMYPDRDKVVSRLGDREYQHARQRIEELSQ